MSFSYTTTLALRRPLAVAYCLTARHIAWVTLLAAILQCAIALVAVPSLAGLFSVSTRAAGVSAVTTTDVAQFLSSPLGVAL